MAYTIKNSRLLKGILIGVLVTLGFFILAAVGFLAAREGLLPFFATQTPTPTQTFTSTNTPTETQTFTPSVTPTPTVATSNVNIKVTSPAPYGEVSSPIQIRGEARVFENIVNFSLKDASGAEITTGSAYANSPDVGLFGSFEEDLYFSTSAKEGTLEVFWYSPKDGSEIDKIIIPLRFK